jgi:putative hydrolase of the HAD superfamily
MRPNSLDIRPNFIVLDLDNTLYEYEYCHSNAINKLIEFLSNNLSLDIEFVEDGLELARKRVKQRLGCTASSHSRIAYINEFVIQTGKHVSVSLVAHAERVYWLAFFDNMILRKGVQEFLNYANESNIRIYLVTDLTLSIQIEKLQKLGLESAFSFVISSEEAGGDKITNLPFKSLTELLGPTPGFYWAIGDKCWDFPQALGISGREFAVEKINCEHDHETLDFVELLRILRKTSKFEQKSGQS